MKKSTLKGILVAVVVVALIIGGIALANTIERRSEKAPAGAGTSTVSREPEAAPEADPMDGSEAAPVEGSEEETPEAGAEEAPSASPAMIDYESQTMETVNVNGKNYALNDNISTLLLIGVDEMEVEQSKGYRNPAMADFLVLAVFDNELHTCKLLQINRNTMADVPMLGAAGDYIGLTTEQITYAHSYGDGLEESGENTALAVSRFLYGVDIDNYLSMAMGGIAALNDAVGGVTVTIEDDFTGVDDTLVQGETVTLMGEHAFNFVHARFNMTDDANTSRMRRQSAYMTALVAKLREKLAEDDAFILELYNAVADYVVTDCDINELSQISEELSTYELSGIVTPEGETTHDGEYTEFYADEKALQQLVADLFYVPAE